MGAVSLEVKTVYGQAREINSADERAEFLNQACQGRAELRAQVEELLRSIEDAGDFMAEAAVKSLATVEAPPREAPGTQIGPYKLREQIGEGGFGVVYAAEQERPVRRKVALKIIKPGMDSTEVIARFEAERQALALMDHPNIATVLDAGTTESARPYFVMELVRGIPITEYCDTRRLTTRQRLDLFVATAQAIQHAHQKGVIHRDVKPSNVMVTEHDGTPLVKVIDFGVAKAINQRLTERTIYTRHQQMVGTPLYMSPEQAELSALDVDTRSDIYSLGVLLYELLTGTTPLDKQRFREVAYDEMRRIIREEEPPKPSTRISTLGDDTTSVTQHRNTDLTKLRNTLRGDLDWIVMKCLEKDRTRRYGTASGLTLDIERHLKHEPVIARPPSVAYRLQKAWQRHRIGYLAAAAVMSALVIGIAISTWQAAVAKREKREAELARAAARESATAEKKQRLVAEKNESAAIQAKELAEGLEWEARRTAYAADMNLVQRALESNNIGRALSLLNRYRPRSGGRDLRGWEWRYLWQHCQSQEQFMLCRRPHSIEAIEVSSDGRWIAIGEFQSEVVTVWDVRKRTRIGALDKNKRCSALKFSPTEPIVAYADFVGSDSMLRLWDVEAMRQIRVLPMGNSVKVKQISFTSDGKKLVAELGNGNVTVWRVEDGAHLTTHDVGQSSSWLQNAMQVTGDQRLLVRLRHDRHVEAIDLESGEVRWQRRMAEWNVQALALSPSEPILATASAECPIHLWDLDSGEPIGQLDGHRAWCSALVFYPDGKTLASASSDQTIRIWDLNTRKPIHVLQGHRQEIWDLKLMPDAKTLVSGSKDGEVKLWSTSAVVTDESDPQLIEDVWNWRLSPDGRFIFLVDRAAGRVWQLEGPLFDRKRLLIETDRLESVVYSETGWILGGASQDGDVEIWDLQQKQLLHEFKVGESLVLIGFTRRGTIWLHLKETDELQEWNIDQGVVHRTIPMPSHSRSSFWDTRTFADPFFFHIQNNGQGFIMNLQSGFTTNLQLNTSDRTFASAFSPDRKFLALAHEPGVLTVWDPHVLLGDRDPVPKVTLSGSLNAFRSVAFTKDNSRLAAGSQSFEAVKLWDSQSHQELLTLPGKGGNFRQIAFSHDGRLLAACNDQGVLHVWRAPDWAQIEETEQAQVRRSDKSGG